MSIGGSLPGFPHNLSFQVVGLVSGYVILLFYYYRMEP